MQLIKISERSRLFRRDPSRFVRGANVAVRPGPAAGDLLARFVPGGSEQPRNSFAAFARYRQSDRRIGPAAARPSQTELSTRDRVVRDAAFQRELETGNAKRGRVQRAAHTAEIALDQVHRGDEEPAGDGRHGRVQGRAGEFEIQNHAGVQGAEDA